MNIGWPNNSKEWKMLLVIIVFIEFILLHFIYSAGGNKDFINLFSFGATIVSIILALVAIFYTFLQVESQKEDSRHLSSQINALKIVSGELKEVQGIVSTVVQQMNESYENVNKIISPIHETHESIKGLHKKIESLLGSEFNRDSPTKNPIENSNLNTNDFREGVIDITTSSLIGKILLYTLKKSSPLLPIDKFEIIYTHFAIPCNKASGGEILTEKFFLGVANTILKTYEKSGIINIDDKQLVSLNSELLHKIDLVVKDLDKESKYEKYTLEIDKSFS